MLLRYALAASGRLDGLLVSHLDAFRHVPGLRWCEAYETTVPGEESRAAGWLAPAGRVTRLPCTAREDLAHQAALTDLLFRVRPVYQARMLTVAASLLDRLEQAAACPIWFASCGPTHEAVKVCWRQCEVTV